MNNRVHDSIVEEAVRDERNRCALICESFAAFCQRKADGYRNDGTYTTRAIWPPFKKMTFVAPAWERSARKSEIIAETHLAMARCIRSGMKPLPDDPDEKIIIHPAPVTDAEMLEATRKAHGLS